MSECTFFHYLYLSIIFKSKCNNKNIILCGLENINIKKRGSNKNQEARKREAKERKRRSQSKSKSAPEQVIQHKYKRSI